MIQIVSKKHWVTHELQGTSIFNKDDGTYNPKKDSCMNGKKIWKSLLGDNISWENLFSVLSRIQRICKHMGVHSTILSALV